MVYFLQVMGLAIEGVDSRAVQLPVKVDAIASPIDVGKPGNTGPMTRHYEPDSATFATANGPVTQSLKKPVFPLTDGAYNPKGQLTNLGGGGFGVKP